MMFWIFGDIEIFDNFAEFLQILPTLKRPRGKGCYTPTLFAVSRIVTIIQSEILLMFFFTLPEMKMRALFSG